MIKPICERGKTCLFLEKKIEEYSYPIHARSQIIKRGKQLNYYCNNPKRFNRYELPKRLNHTQKFRKCPCKVTNKLEEFFKI